ncbi:MAG: peptide chain release factor 1 [Oligoflexia bacterium]|nr:peptide chain release factor 1 [Oligoflexia bacterium]
MFKKLDEVEKRFVELGELLTKEDVVSDSKKYATTMKEYSSIQELVATYREYKKTKSEIDSSKEILQTEKDQELIAMAKAELPDLEKKIQKLEGELKILLLPKDPNDDKNIIIEIRAGAGGDESSLFAEQLFTMYTKFATKNGWRVEMMSMSPGNAGGVKEVIGSIQGEKVFSKLKYESGVHRVQRVPKTETQGRIHTSTVTVAVLPEAEEVDIDIKPQDLRIDVYRSGGPGGQSVNTTDSAVRVTHIPSGVVVACQDEKSQIKNKSKALKILYARLYEYEMNKKQSEQSQQRKSQIGTGDRSERIRTYNFPQGRVTDHRIGLTLYQIDKIMAGELDELVVPLITHYQAEALKSQ